MAKGYIENQDDTVASLADCLEEAGLALVCFWFGLRCDSGNRLRASPSQSPSGWKRASV